MSAASIQPREALSVRASNASVAATYEVRAKFLDFEMGDVEHYLFEDEQGNIIDFTGFENDVIYELKEALPPNAHNDFNKGWSSNSLFQGKWFLLQCTQEQQPAYEGGPNTSSAVILKASLL